MELPEKEITQLLTGSKEKFVSYERQGILSKAFKAFQRDLKDHKRSYDSLIEELKCDQCNLKFKSKFNRSRHMKTLHESDVHICEICSVSFNRYDNLKRHIKYCAYKS